MFEDTSLHVYRNYLFTCLVFESETTEKCLDFFIMINLHKKKENRASEENICMNKETVKMA